MINSRLLTVEDSNSVIDHFGKCFIDYYMVDTRLFSSESVWTAYDFMEIVKTPSSIDVNINNDLWTGGYLVKDCNISNPTVNVEGNVLTVTGDGLEWIVILLELTPIFNHDTDIDLDYTSIYTPVIRPFYEDIYLTMGFMDSEDSPCANMRVRDLMKNRNLNTNSDGLVTVKHDIAQSKLYDYLLECTHENTGFVYKFPFERIKVDLPVILLTENIIKNKKQLISFKFLFDNQYNILDEMLFTDNNILLTVNNNVYSIESYSDGVFDFLVDLTNVDSDTINLVLHIGGNTYLNSNKLIFTEQLNYFTASDANILQAELDDTEGAEIIIYAGTGFDGSVQVDRPVEIRFTGGGYWWFV